MKTRLTAAGAILLLVGTPASAHRLDEYLQATTISVEKDRVQAQIRLTPGVAVFPIVLENIDTDADGVISEAEQRAYAERVLGDLSLTIDGDRLRLRLVSLKFAKIEEMKEGLGEIQLEFDADVPSGGPNRRLIFENQHQSRIAAYLVNCLVPRDPGIRITAQNRNYQQSFYRLDYMQDDVRSGPQSSSWSSSRGWLGAAALLLLAGFGFVRRRARVANDAIAQK
jgi:MYXO-CTERM domain-containing protein